MTEAERMQALLALSQSGDNGQPEQRGPVEGAILTAGQGLTYGLSDEINAALSVPLGASRQPDGTYSYFNYEMTPRDRYNSELEKSREVIEGFQSDNPVTSKLLEVGGAMALPSVGLSRIPSAAPKAVKLGAAMAAGAGAGAAHGFGTGEGGRDERLENAGTGAIWGAGGGAAGYAAGSALQRLLTNRARNKATNAAVRNAPTTDELRRLGTSLYREVNDAGVSISPAALDKAKTEIRDYLTEQGAGFTGSEKVLPASRSILDSLDDVGAGNTVPFGELDMYRRYVGGAAGANPVNKADTRAATGALTRLDDFVAGLTPDDVDAGDIEALQSALPKAKEVWARMSRSGLIDDAIENAENYQSGLTSGIRNQFRRILNNPKLRRGFSDEEIRVIRKVVNGSIGTQVANYLGSGLGMLGQIGLGAAGGGMLGAAAGTATAMGTRKLAELATVRAAERARAAVAAPGGINVPAVSEAPRALMELLTRRAAAVQQ